MLSLRAIKMPMLTILYDKLKTEKSNPIPFAYRLSCVPFHRTAKLRKITYNMSLIHIISLSVRNVDSIRTHAINELFLSSEIKNTLNLKHFKCTYRLPSINPNIHADIRNQKNLPTKFHFPAHILPTKPSFIKRNFN